MDVRIFGTESTWSPTWKQAVTPLGVGRENGTGWRRAWQIVRNTAIARRTLARKDVVIFTDDAAVTGNLYGLLARGLPRPTIVRTDPFITTSRSRWHIWLRRACLANMDHMIVWAPAIADRYHAVLGVPREKMTAVHYHHTLRGYTVPSEGPGDYLFSGGDSMRDYPTLLEAVRDLPIPVRVATRWQPPAGTTVPANVTLGPTSPTEFRALLAGSRLAVFPLRTDTLRTAGQQSYLNAMALGKAVVVTDLRDAPYYIEHGKTGQVVPSADPVALRASIAELLDSPRRAREIGEQARLIAEPLDQEHTWSRVVAIAQEAHRRRWLHRSTAARAFS